VHHAFDVTREEYDQAKEKLQAWGATVLRDEYRDDGVFNGRSLYFRDPSGNVLEVIDRTEFGRKVGTSPTRMTRS
jgi:predicted lactoylglutathione lyase